MDNWFYMDRKTFERLLFDELGTNLAPPLISMGFDTPISFMIGVTSDEILSKIQQTISLLHCRKTTCNDHCLTCSILPPHYAKLFWFVQRLIIMSPLSKPFIKPNSSSKLLNDNSTSVQGKNPATNQQSPSSNNDFGLYILFILILLARLSIVFESGRG
jgi:hypothetical protein